MKKNKVLYLFLFVLFACITVFSCNDTYANVEKTDWSSTVTKKALLAGVERCYMKGGFDKEIKNVDRSVDTVDLVTDTLLSIALPSGLTENKNDKFDNCLQFIFGQKKKNSATVLKGNFIDASGRNSDLRTITTTTEGTMQILEKFGYVPMNDGSQRNCGTINYVDKNPDTQQYTLYPRTISFCYDKNGITLENVDAGFQVSVDNTEMIELKTGKAGFNLTVKRDDESFYSGDILKEKKYLVYADGSNHNTIFSDICRDFNTYYGLSGDGLHSTNFMCYDNEITTSVTTTAYQFKNGWGSSAFRTFLNTVAPEQSYDKLSFTDQEKLQYYVSTLKNTFLQAYDIVHECGITDATVMSRNYIKLNVNKSMQKDGTCGLFKSQISNDEMNKTIYGFDKQGKFDASGATKLNLEQTVAEINRLIGDVPDGQTVVDPDEGGASNVGNTADCYGAGLDSQSWIICPAINNMTSVVDGLDGMVGSLLVTKTAYYDASSKTYSAWQTFRDIANVFIGVVLMLIILSQLTGYGIDNYGIKKMLPKLIIMAVLINLSFFICQAAIDLSNILGDGLDQLFRGIAGSTGEESANIGRYMAGFVMGSFGSIAAAGSALEFGSLAIGAATGGGVTVAISLLLALLVVLVSVLLFFIMVGARTIIVILFTAIAPVAFALYILPNTQKYFKKWWDIFKAALVIYPICGALYGISFLIRTITPATGSFASLGDFAIQLAAVIAPFLPFLILPTLLKSAINALGVVGGAISSLGGSLRKGITSGNRALQGTNAYKAGMENSRRNMTRWNAGLDRDGNVRDVSRFGRFVRGGKSGMAAARSQYLGDKNKATREESLMGAGFEAAKINQQKAAEADNTRDYETLANYETNNGANEEKLFDMYRQYVAEGNKSGAIAVARVAGRRKDTAARFISECLTGRDLSGDKLAKFNESYSSANSAAIFNSVSKEIAEGVNSKNFRAASPTEFDFISGVNKEPSAAVPSYGAWSNATDLAGAANIATSINRGITNSGELVGMSAKSLKELDSWMAKTGELISNTNREELSVDDQKAYDTIVAERKKVQALAASTLANKDKPGGVWDYTVDKATAIGNIASAASTEAAAQNEVFTVQQPSNVGSALAADQFAATAAPAPAPAVKPASSQAPQKPSVQDDRPARGTYKPNENGDWVKK